MVEYDIGLGKALRFDFSTVSKDNITFAPQIGVFCGCSGNPVFRDSLINIFSSCSMFQNI